MSLWQAAMAASAAMALILTAGASAANAPDGKALYHERCGMCHQTIGMAVGILSRRPADESKGFLEDRKDLSATFVRTVVRTGIANMPRMPRGEVSDAELQAIADYLAKGRP
ncbi:MAG: cytochrome c [Pseudomonadota bacterium]|nr:cytochrome c [Pseudomonadota bacterium]